jgi:NhaP-type Na+/H+ or K+/H+ antiporter
MGEVLIVAVSLYAFAMVSARLSMSPVTAAMVFTTIGLIVGTGGLGWFDLDLEAESVSIVVEATLVLVLFTDAIRIDLRALRHQATFPARLLAIGLPLTIVFGTIVAVLLFDELTWPEAALLAAVLAPTDAALGQAVVSNQRLPVRIRQGLNAESGLNDGIMVPVVTVLLAIAAAETQSSGYDVWGEFMIRQVGFGLLSGVVIGLAGGWILHRRAVANHVEGIYRQLATLAVAAAAFATAELLEGNGFIAAFVAGLAFGHIAREQCEGITDFTQDESELLASSSFLLFGAVVAGPLIDQLDWQVALYAVASLTIIRMVPALIGMTGSGTLLETRLFVGWFGPRGLASILFALFVLEHLDSPNTPTIFLVATWTVLASIYAHGLTASPWAGHLATRLADAPATMPEMHPVEEMPTRRPLP